MAVRQEDSPRFWWLWCEDSHIDDLQKSIDEGDLIGLVDETRGGIVAYILPGNEDSLLALLKGQT